MHTSAPRRSQLVTLGEAATVLRCSVASLRRRIRDGRLAAMRLGPGGPIRLLATDVMQQLTPIGDSMEDDRDDGDDGQVIARPTPVWLLGDDDDLEAHLMRRRLRLLALDRRASGDGQDTAA